MPHQRGLVNLYPVFYTQHIQIYCPYTQVCDWFFQNLQTLTMEFFHPWIVRAATHGRLSLSLAFYFSLTLTAITLSHSLAATVLTFAFSLTAARLYFIVENMDDERRWWRSRYKKGSGISDRSSGQRRLAGGPRRRRFFYIHYYNLIIFSWFLFLFPNE